MRQRDSLEFCLTHILIGVVVTQVYSFSNVPQVVHLKGLISFYITDFSKFDLKCKKKIYRIFIVVSGNIKKGMCYALEEMEDHIHIMALIKCSAFSI